MKKLCKIGSCIFLAIFVIAFSGCESKDKNSLDNTEKIKTIKLPGEKDNVIDLQLYFDSSKSENESKVTKEQRVINKDELMAKLIMDELIKGPYPKSDLKPVLPQKARVLSISIKDNIAYVNLNLHQDETELKLTEAKEKTILESIVKSLTQLPSIQKVKILIDNKTKNTLGGHFDISKPLSEADISNLQKVK